jgi:DNA-binding MarR family transcriptional regulator
MTDQRPIGFWLKLVDRLIDERFADTLEEHGVTRRQWQLLNVLSRGQSTGAQLDATLMPFLSAVDGETINEHLSELVDSGWVALSPSGYSLADSGRNALAALASTVDKTRAVTADGISEHEYENTLGTLERMAQNLGWTEPTPAATIRDASPAQTATAAHGGNRLTDPL